MLPPKPLAWAPFTVPIWKDPKAQRAPLQQPAHELLRQTLHAVQTSEQKPPEAFLDFLPHGVARLRQRYKLPLRRKDPLRDKTVKVRVPISAVRTKGLNR